MHCALEFNQSQWLKQFIEFNTQKRKKKKKKNDKDGKALYKLINNAIYGKTIENFRNRINVKVVNNEKGYLKWTSKPSYTSRKRFNHNLVGIYKSKLALKFNKHTCIAMCILKLSKVLMYKFHYD